MGPPELLFSSSSVAHGELGSDFLPLALALAKLPVALPWHFLKVVLDVVHNVAKIPLILHLQSKRFSSLF